MRLYQEIGGHLRRDIHGGKYAPGDRLPPERDIAESFSVSRSVVREALIMLELEKVVDVRKGSGVYVLPPPENSQPEGADSGYGPLNCFSAAAAGERSCRLCCDASHQNRYSANA